MRVQVSSDQSNCGETLRDSRHTLYIRISCILDKDSPRPQNANSK